MTQRPEETKRERSTEEREKERKRDREGGDVRCQRMNTEVPHRVSRGRSSADLISQRGPQMAPRGRHRNLLDQVREARAEER